MKLLTLRRLMNGIDSSPDHVSLIQHELNGGKTTSEQIDQLVDAAPFRYLTISGLEQKTLEHLVKRVGDRLEGLHFWKCPRIDSLQPLENMPRLECAAMFWNQRTDRLWNLAATPRLHGLRFTDFIKLKRLDDLAQAQSLREFEFGADVSGKKLAFDSLAPLAGLVELQDLAVGAQAIADERIEPLATLRGLQSLGFGTSLFRTEQVAWLRTRLPALVCEELDGFRTIGKPLRLRGKAIDTFVVGHGKPSLDSQADAARLAKYRREFEAMLDFFRQHPQARPEDYVAA